MIPSRIIALARRQSWCTTDIVTEAESFEFLTIILNDFRDDITLSTPGYWLTTWDYNLVADTDEYTLAIPAADTTVAASTFWISKVTKIWVKPNWNETKYKPYDLEYIEGMRNLPDFYSNIWDSALIYDTSIRLFPTPTTAVTDWLRVIGYKSHFDLSASTEDIAWAMLIPAKRHYVLIEGLKFWMYGNMGVNFDSARMNVKSFYESEKLKAIQQLTDRTQDAPESEDLFIWDFN